MSALPGLSGAREFHQGAIRSKKQERLRGAEPLLICRWLPRVSAAGKQARNAVQRKARSAARTKAQSAARDRAGRTRSAMGLAAHSCEPAAE